MLHVRSALAARLHSAPFSCLREVKTAAREDEASTSADKLVFHKPSHTLYRLDNPALRHSRKPEIKLQHTEKITFAKVSWQPATFKRRELPAIYASLIKSRLTGLVVMSGMAGYFMCPGPFLLGSLAGMTGGTALLSAAANSLNQFLEVPYDSQMKRTLGRPLVRGVITPLHALAVSVTCCVSGFGILYLVSPTAAGLGLLNVALYAGLYTPMKRYSIGCTWAGAVVGAIPPLMGWAAAGGEVLSVPAFTLAAILYAWQFPHFNSLSWNLRPDYSRAGYRVMCVTNPGLCLRTSLRYSASLIALCSLAAPLGGLTTWTFAADSLPFNLILLYLSYKSALHYSASLIALCPLAAPLGGLTTWTFAADSLPFNLILLYLSYKFYEAPDSQNSRQLFRFTLLYLPAVMLLMLISKPTPPTPTPPPSLGFMRSLTH